MNVDAYAQETEFVMRIRPRDGGIFEAELYAGGFGEGGGGGVDFADGCGWWGYGLVAYA